MEICSFSRSCSWRFASIRRCSPAISVGARFLAASSMLWFFTRMIVSFNAFSCSPRVVSSLIFVWNRLATSRCSSSSVKWFMICAGFTCCFSYCSYNIEATVRYISPVKSSGEMYLQICENIFSSSINHDALAQEWVCGLMTFYKKMYLLTFFS